MKCNFYSYILALFKNIKEIFFNFLKIFLAKQLIEVSASKKCLGCVDDLVELCI